MPKMPTKVFPLKIPQARVLRALMPPDGAHEVDWPEYNRVTLAARAGFNPTTGTINRVLNGVPEGSSTGAAHPGLIELRLITTSTYILDTGRTETNYRITAAGVRALAKFLADGHKIPPVKSKSSCVNDRYSPPLAPSAAASPP